MHTSTAPRGATFRAEACLRILPKLMAMAALLLFPSIASAQGPDQDRYIVEFKASGGDRARAAIAAAGGSVLLDLPAVNAAAARIPPQALTALRNNPNIALIEPDSPRYPVAQTVPYGITMVQAQQIPEVAPGSNAAKVCVIDSGIDSTHEDFAGAILSGTDLPRSGGGTNLWYTDSCGHGTHVAGTIVAQDNKWGVVGTTPGVQLHSVKVFDGSNCAWTYASSLINAAYACRDAGTDIINMSLGCNGSRCSSSTENRAFADLESQGILSVAAAGNAGDTSFSYPASYASVVSVAAVDENEQRASFSQQNSQVELAAPGVRVRSTLPGNKYGSYSGTSMATPHVAGVAARIWNHDRGWTNTQVRSALQNGAKDLGAAGWDPAFGFGLVQAKDTLAYLTGGDKTDPPAAPEEPAPNTPPTANFTFQCTDLTCAFDGSASSDADGSISAYAWSFGDGRTGSGRTINHSFASAGSYTVTLTVTDNAGASAVSSEDITLTVTVTPPDDTVTPPDETRIELTGTVSKTRGTSSVRLAWSGATSTHVDVYRDGRRIATTSNTGSYLDDLRVRGSGVLEYRVCEAGNTTTCSATVSVVY